LQSSGNIEFQPVLKFRNISKLSLPTIRFVLVSQSSGTLYLPS
jgi:hypothetical protein